MNWSQRDFMATMEQGKALAQTRRNRGQGSGKAAKGWIKIASTDRPPQRKPTSRERASAYGLCAVEMAIEDHTRALHPERYEAFV